MKGVIVIAVVFSVLFFTAFKLIEHYKILEDPYNWALYGAVMGMLFQVSIQAYNLFKKGE